MSSIVQTQDFPKRNVLIGLLFIFVFGQTIAQPLDIIGTYTIDPAGGAFNPGINDNFQSFTEAADTLVSRGVGGAVSINVADGNYDERFFLDVIPGTGPGSIVTFQSASQDSSSVFVSYSGHAASTIAAIVINGASYVRFKHLGFDATGGASSYGQAIWLGGGSHHIYVENCNFIGKISGSSSVQDNRALIHGWGNDIEYLEFRNNRFTFGEDGIKISGTSGARGMIIESNEFYDQTEGAIYLREQDAPIVRNNYIYLHNTTRRVGVQFDLVDKGFEVSGNQLDLDDPNIAMYFNTCNGTPGDAGMIFNNFVSCRSRGGSNNRGIDINNSTYLKFYHNSVYLRSGWVIGSIAFYQQGGGNNIDLQNNIFHNHSAGYAINISNGSSIIYSNNNNYFTNGNYLGKWGNSDRPKLSDIRAGSGDDDASISVNSWFNGGADLHTTNYRIDGKGANLLGDVPTDFDGEARSATPDIGADEFPGVGSALAGEYFIGGSGADFATIEDAGSSLNEFGISAPVTFSIRDDDSPYDAVLNIEPISGSSETNTVSFRADPSNSGSVIITHDGASGGNHTVHIERASHLRFENLILSADNSTNSTVVRFNSLCENIVFDGCTMNSLGTNSNNAGILSIDNLLSDVEVTGCTFTGGNRGILINGFDTYSLKVTGLNIDNNVFTDHYRSGVYLRDCIAPKINNNTASPGSSSYNYWGINLDYCHNNYEIIGNKILYNVDDGGIGVGNSTGSSTFVGKIINNYIEMDGANDPVSGIYLYSSTYVDVFYNTSRIYESNNNTGSNAFANSGGSNIKVKNNNFVNFGTGRAYYNDNASAINESDHNNLFTTGLYLAQWGGTGAQALDDLQSLNGMDVNTLSVNPWFTADNKPDINSFFLDGKGVAISGITTDFKGLNRQSPPDIGALEYTASTPPLNAGAYTIGGNSPDYVNVIDAMSELQLRGVTGAVTFNIRSGDYDEHIGTINKIPGASEENTITLKSETGNPGDVTIFKITDNTGGPFNVINLRGVDYFTIRDLTISALGGTGGRPLRIGETYTNVSVINNILTSSNTTNATLVVSGIGKNILVKDNTITNGNGGIYFQHDLNNYGTNNVISGNHISGGQYYGISIKHQISPVVTGNVIENSVYTSFEGIYAELLTDQMVITGNTINNQNTDYGINIVNCDATNPFYGMVSNNFIRVGGTYTSYGIYIHQSTRTFIYHNSINITSTHANNGVGINIQDNNSAIEVKNNVVANTGAGWAMSIEDMGDIDYMDYNNIYSKGTNFIWTPGTTYSNLTEWRAAFGTDMNSISEDPMYFSDSDLHTMQIAFHQAGTAAPEVTYDIDSVLRDPVEPDLGASEFSCREPVWNIYVEPVCLGDTSVIIDSSLYITPGSTRGWDMTGDLVPDVYTENPYDTIKWVFNQPGSNTMTYIVQQIAGCNHFTAMDAPLAPEPVLEIETQGAYCDTDDGWAEVTVSNQEGPFDYYWSTGGSTSRIENLSLGTYTVTVRDQAAGCSTDTIVEIGEAIQVKVTQLSPSTCGTPDGSAIVEATGGVGTYAYVWSNGETTQSNDILSPGPHYVNVIDEDGCYAQGFINIESEGGPQISLSDMSNNECYGEREGSLDISISGGVAPYDILWSNGATSEDVSGLASGLYNVLVEDAEGCLGSGSFEVGQPAQLTITPIVTPSTCEGADGKAVALVGGGVRPYVYQWSTGGIFEIEEGLAAGIYSVAVRDAEGCEMVSPVIINNEGAPDVRVTEVQGVGCTITDNGFITVTASPTNPFYSFLWSNGQNTPTITGLEADTYEVTVTDENGCKGLAQAVVEQEAPDVNPICIVSVDTVTGKNLILWSKEYTEDVSHYNVYRETSVKGLYQRIDSVLVNEESIYLDEVADPSIRSWRYKISVVDECGEESDLSPHHKTMHLTMNKGLNGVVNLIWDHYEGFEVTTYKVWRFDAVNGWDSIANMPSNLTSYTDQNPPNEDLTYFIEVLHPAGCTSTDKKPASLNSSRSNRRSSKKGTSSGLFGDILGDYSFSIYPNPGKGLYKLDLEHGKLEAASIKIYDVSGKMVSRLEFKDARGRIETQLDLTGLADGMYQVQITTANIILHRILIKE